MNESADTEPTPDSDVISPFKVALIVSAIVIAVMAAVTAWVWLQLPADAKVPIHWNARGEVDGWAGRGSLLLVPGMIVFTVTIMALVPIFEPRRGHFLRSSKAYMAVWYGMLGFFLVLHGAITWAALGNKMDMNLVMGVSLGLLFIVMGNYFGKIRSNYILGIRTPWTLSSELSWNKTHRLGGRLFVILGILILLGGIFDPAGKLLWVVIVAGVIGLIGITFPYSYFVWKNDPEKEKVGR